MEGQRRAGRRRCCDATVRRAPSWRRWLRLAGGTSDCGAATWCWPPEDGVPNGNNDDIKDRFKNLILSLKAGVLSPREMSHRRFIHCLELRLFYSAT